MTLTRNGKLDTYPYVYNDVTMADERLAQPSTGASGAASTTVNVSSLAGTVSVQQNSTVWPVQVPSSQSVQVKNSTIGDLLASVQQNSTVWAVQIPSSQSVQVKNSTIGELLASVQQNSTTWAVQVDGRVRAQNSTIGDLLASVQQNSTVWQVQASPGSTAFVKAAGFSVDSSNALNVKLDGSTAITIGSIAAAAGRLNIGSTAADNAVTATLLAGSTLAVRPLQSSASDLRVSAFLFDSTGNAIETSTKAGSTATSTARGVVTRAAIPDCTSIGVRLATAGDNTILTSAVTSIYVYALGLSAGLTSTGPSTGSSAANVRFQNGTTSASLWSFQYSMSSLGAEQAALAVTPPAYLFKTGPSNLLNVSATSTGAYVSVSAWRE